jgi:hypothetical protein
VRIHKHALSGIKWINVGGLLVTRPSRIVADLLSDREDPEAVARIMVEAIRKVYDYPGTFAESLAPFSAQFGLRRGDGYALLRWLLDLVGDPETPLWLNEARETVSRGLASESSAAGGSE